MPGFSEQVVLDTGVFIRLKQIEQFGNKFFCTPSVVTEIRDHHARKHASLISNSVVVLSPSKDCIEFVKTFSSLTGDRDFLSDTDIDVIALTLMLQRNTGNVTHLLESPSSIQTLRNISKKNDIGYNYNYNEDYENDSNIDSLYLEEKTVNATNQKVSEERVAANTASITHSVRKSYSILDHNLDTSKADNKLQNDASSKNQNISVFDEWVTHENLHRFGIHVKENECMEVACMTTDFSIQNVLLQIGLHVLSFDGYRIMSAKLWGLVCRGCHFFERDSARKFCSRCGNDCVEKVPFKIDHTGQRRFEDIERRPNLRGTVYSLPKPSRGRKKELILAEDQLMMGGFQRELNHKIKLYEAEKVAKNPFYEDSTVNQKGWWHRSYLPCGKLAVLSAPKVVIGMGKGNPNSNRWNKRNRKVETR